MSVYLQPHMSYNKGVLIFCFFSPSAHIVEYSADGTVVAIINSTTIRIYNTATREPLATIEHPKVLIHLITHKPLPRRQRYNKHINSHTHRYMCVAFLLATPSCSLGRDSHKKYSKRI